jgi:coenzyme F420-reducing hydrogenase beta subunit
MCYANYLRTEYDLEDLEGEAFGRTRVDDEELTGVMNNCYAVRARDGELLDAAQDGGAVTAILSSFLSSDGEVVIVAGGAMRNHGSQNPL